MTRPLARRNERRYRRGETAIEVLSGADLALWPGQSVALIAPSGAGKSTLLHWRACWRGPTAARSMSAAGDRGDADDKRTAMRRVEIGFVYQFHHLLPEFSAAREHHPAADDPRTGAAERPSARASCSPISASRARESIVRRELSGGEQQRVAIARARRQRAARAAGGRADRQPRPQDRRPRVRDFRGARPRRAGWRRWWRPTTSIWRRAWTGG